MTASSLTIGGVLTNAGNIDIGNTKTLATTTLKAGGLANTGTPLARRGKCPVGIGQHRGSADDVDRNR